MIGALNVKRLVDAAKALSASLAVVEADKAKLAALIRSVNRGATEGEREVLADFIEDFENSLSCLTGAARELSAWPWPLHHTHN
jgi:hypothetical protein